jgi:methylase of polypeptide subunit release factors
MTRLARRRLDSAPGSVDALAAAGRLLARLGFTAANVEAAVGVHAASLSPLDAPLYDARLSDELPESLATLIRLFVLGERVEAPAIARSLDGAAEVLERAGLIAVTGGRATARWHVAPHGDLLLAADPDVGDDDRERVLGVTPSSLKVARLTPRRRIAAALDVGTGCGVQALLATAHADRVTAVDVNPRAVALARLNAGLNDRPLEVAESDWFSALDERALDLIVANLPYTLGPERGSLYDRLPPYAANAVLRQVLAGAGSRLADAGIAVVACAWTPPSPDEWVRPVVDWLAELRCDAILFRHGLHDAGPYASANARHAAAPARAAAIRAWLDSLAAANVEWVATGVVILRRSTGARAWITAFEDVSFPGPRGGSMVERMFEAGSLLAASPPARRTRARPYLRARRPRRGGRSDSGRRAYARRGRVAPGVALARGRCRGAWQ